MPVKDIGGGNTLVDLGASLGSPMELYRLKAAMEDQNRQNALAPFQQQKAMQDAQKAQIDAEKSRVELSQKAYSLFVAGDNVGANRLYQQYVNPSEVLIPHSDKAKAAKKIFQIQNMQTGESRDYDFMAETRLNEAIKLQADLAKKSAEIDLADSKGQPKVLYDTALELVKQNRVSSLNEGLQFARAAFDEARLISNQSRQRFDPKGPGQQYAQLGAPRLAANQVPSHILENRIAAGMEMDAARQYDSSILDRPLKPLQPIPDKERNELKGYLSVQRQFGQDMLPRLIQINESTLKRPGLINSPIQNLLTSFGEGSTEYQALKAMTNRALFEQAFALSGAAYSDKQLEGMRGFIPNTSDTVPQAIAKISAMMALNANAATSSFEILDASSIDTGGMRKLFQGVESISSQDKATATSAAQFILNSIDKTIPRGTPEFNQFLNNLPPSIRSAAFDEEAKSGNGTAEGFEDKFKRLRGK